VGFFHASGYQPFMQGQNQPLIPPNQALAQLHYTFAAHEGDQGAQMALGYRYWSGIGTLEDCGRALEWYEAAAENGMFLAVSSGPLTKHDLKRWKSMSLAHQVEERYHKPQRDCQTLLEVSTALAPVSHQLE
jgi:TPR repeat protein